MFCRFALIRAVCAALLLSSLVSGRASAATIADSIAEWSTTGTQGENSWINGYYNLTADPDATYSISDFTAFLNDGSGNVGADGANHWGGSGYRLYRDTDPATGPWTSLNQESAHPNGLNSSPPATVPGAVAGEHWVIRRWVSDYSGEASITSNLAAENTACGNGTSVHLFHNGELIDTLTTNSGAGVSNIVGRTLAAGDLLDLALTPVGTDGAGGDGCDGSFFSMMVSDEPPPPPPVPPLADSLLDWSASGTQGEKNWFNGYYNLTTDADKMYQSDDFIAFTNTGAGDVAPDGNHWNGTAFDLTASGGPWTTLAAESVHPNGENSAPNEEHWVIRRWVAADLEETTPLEVTWSMAKSNANNDGVTGVLFVNGEQVDAATIAGNDTTGVTRSYVFSASPGDLIDLALTPEGVTNRTDGSDGSVNRLTIRVVPEPGSLLLTAFGIGGLLLVRRRRA